MSLQSSPQLYHRLKNPYTQTDADALLQQSTGKIMGKAASYSSRPSVKAYMGPLPPGHSGIEFKTDVAHDARYSTPDRANWLHPDTPGVGLTQINGVDYAWIPATVLRIVP